MSRWRPALVKVPNVTNPRTRSTLNHPAPYSIQMASTATPRASRRRRGSRSRRGGEGLEPIPREAWTRLAACTAAAALLQLDGTVITVALPNVAHSLHVSNSATAIVLSAYFAAYAIMLFPGGRLVDRLGARKIALTGLVIFAIGAALGAVVNSLALLTVTRAIQGLGAGLVSPAALAGAISGFPPDRRGTALGIWGASAGMANLVGPLVGGLLTIAWGSARRLVGTRPDGARLRLRDRPLRPVDRAPGR